MLDPFLLHLEENHGSAPYAESWQSLAQQELLRNLPQDREAEPSAVHVGQLTAKWDLQQFSRVYSLGHPGPLHHPMSLVLILVL